MPKHTKHFADALELIKKRLLTLAAVVEEQLRDSATSLADRDSLLAQRIIARDLEVDQMEVDLEEECLKVLALHQPVALDLRFLVSVLKITNDLERIGDLACNMAHRSIQLSTLDPSQYPFDINPMVEKTTAILRLSIDSMIELDIDMARQVLEDDEEIDRLHSRHFKDVRKAIDDHPGAGAVVIEFLSLSRYLERIADLATNIAEDVIYLIDGQIIRHGLEPKTGN